MSIRQVFQGHYKKVLLIIFLLLGYSLCMYAKSSYLADLLMKICIEAKSEHIMILFYVFIFECLTALCMYLENILEEKIKGQIRVKYRNRLGEKMLKQPPKKLIDMETYDYMGEQVSKVDLFSDEYLDQFFAIIYSGISMLIYISFIARRSIVVALLLLLSVLLAKGMSYVFEKYAGIIFEKYMKAREDYIKAVNDYVMGIAEIRYNNAYYYIKKRSSGEIGKYTKDKWKYDVTMSGLSNLTYLPLFMIDMTIFACIVAMVYVGKCPASMLILYITLGGSILNAGEMFFAARAQFKVAQKNMNLNIVTEDEGEHYIRKHMSAAIIVNNLIVKNEQKTVIKDFSHVFETGKKYMLVGENGCGKSTLMKCLAGLIIPDSGDISFSSELVEKNKLFESVAYMGQDTQIMDSTLYENVFFDEKVSEEEKRRVAEYSGLVEYLKRNNQGWEHTVQSDKSNLSGGEIKMIALARAIAQQKDVYLLDEPFAGINPAIAAKIEQYIMKSPKTIIIITHDWHILDTPEMIKISKGRK